MHIPTGMVRAVCLRAVALGLVALFALGAEISDGGARTEPRLQSMAGSSPLARGEACERWRVEYRVNATLQLTDTPMGAGDGTYRIGPGTLTLSFPDRGGRPAPGEVRLVRYEMPTELVVRSKVLFWRATVTTDALARGTPDACGVVARGNVGGTTLEWTTPLSGYRTDGTITCDGSGCGRPGVPEEGTSPLHIGPEPVEFAPLELSGGFETFQMGYTKVADTDMPQQVTFLSLAGRAVRRECVREPKC